MPVATPFRTRMKSGVILFDGAMGTQIYARGLPPGACLEEWNLSHPEAVREIHAAYYGAGSDVVLTNSFGGNRFLLEKHGFGKSVEAFNIAAAGLAREVCPEGKYVGGSVGPTGEFVEPLGTRSYEELREGFSRQILALAEGGIDLVCIETMSDLQEIRAAIEAARTVCDLPVSATLSFDLGKKGFRTMMGVSPEKAASLLEEAGADIIGCNCGGIDIAAMADLVKAFRQASALPILAQANAGMPRLVEGKTIHPQNPEDFAAGAIPLIEAGATIIGGCCGTTPEHIRAVGGKVRRYLSSEK